MIYYNFFRFLIFWIIFKTNLNLLARIEELGMEKHRFYFGVNGCNGFHILAFVFIFCICLNLNPFVQIDMKLLQNYRLMSKKSLNSLVKNQTKKKFVLKKCANFYFS